MTTDTRDIPLVSVIIPAYREADRIGRTLLEIRDYFGRTGQTYEVLVIADGSPDNTRDVVQNYAVQLPHLRLVDNPENHGKGFVVRQGLLLARGAYRLFMDADGSTSITHLDKFLAEIEQGCDVVIGSRDIHGSFIQIHQPKYRELLGDVGNWLIRGTLGLWKYPDTQCGFKLLSAAAADAIASRMVIDRFGFDFELVTLAERLGFCVKQMPVRWLNEEGSSVTLLGPNGYIQVFIDLFKTRMRLWLGAYRIREYRMVNGQNKKQTYDSTSGHTA